MNILVEYKNTAGHIVNQSHRLSRIAFAKHFAIAGQGYAPRPQKFMRILGMFLHYSYYLKKSGFNNDRFTEPPLELSDPTEKGQFSNLVGKAIADFLSKRIDKSIFTVNYEAAMRVYNPPIPLSIKGRQVSRPDLLAYTSNSIFAIEAKGYSGNSGNMTTHKNQSKTGGIPVNYTVASVSYNLYNKVKCKYHDPYNDNIPYDKELLRRLTKNYYKGLLGFLDEKFFNYQITEFQNEMFYEVDLSYMIFNESPVQNFWLYEIFDFYNPKLILPKNIRELAENGIIENNKPFIFESNQAENNIYIDNDRVGLKINF